MDCGNGVIERSGEGMHNFSNGLVYKGGWERDKMNGIGKLCSDSSIFMRIQDAIVIM